MPHIESITNERSSGTSEEIFTLQTPIRDWRERRIVGIVTGGQHAMVKSVIPTSPTTVLVIFSSSLAGTNAIQMTFVYER